MQPRPFGRSVKTASATDVHRFLALLGLGMLVLHGVALTLDRTVHMPPAALLVPFVMATIHGLTAGTDSSQPWAFGLYLGAVGAVAFATAWRVLAQPSRPIPKPTGGTHVQDRDRAVAL